MLVVTYYYGSGAVDRVFLKWMFFLYYRTYGYGYGYIATLRARHHTQSQVPVAMVTFSNMLRIANATKGPLQMGILWFIPDKRQNTKLVNGRPLFSPAK